MYDPRGFGKVVVAAILLYRYIYTAVVQSAGSSFFGFFLPNARIQLERLYNNYERGEAF